MIRRTAHQSLIRNVMQEKMDKKKYATGFGWQAGALLCLVAVVVVIFLPYHTLMGWQSDPFSDSWLKRQGISFFNKLFAIPLGMLFLMLGAGFHFKGKWSKREAQGEHKLKQI